MKSCSFWGILFLTTFLISYAHGNDAPSVVEVAGKEVDVVVPPKGVLDLDDENFDVLVSTGLQNGLYHFVFFSAPWCGHCKRMSPVWEKLASKVHRSKKLSKKIRVCKVDATQQKFITSRFEVKGYPTLYMIKPDATVAKYNGHWDMESLTDFVQGGHKLPKYEDVDLFGPWTLYLARWKARIHLADTYLLGIQKWSGLSAPWFRVVAAPCIMTVMLTVILGSYGLYVVGKGAFYRAMGWPDPEEIEAARWRAREREGRRRREAMRGAHGIKREVSKNDEKRDEDKKQQPSSRRAKKEKEESKKDR